MAWTMTSRAQAGTALAMMLLAPPVLSAQPVGSRTDSVPALGPVKWDLGFSVVGAQPVGEFADYVDMGAASDCSVCFAWATAGR